MRGIPVTANSRFGGSTERSADHKKLVMSAVARG